MKKVITIIILFCFVLCACSKADSAPVATPSSTNTPAPTQTAEITPTPTIASTETPTATPTPIESDFNLDTTCVVCGRITYCKEFVKKSYDLDLGMFIEKAYYLCENCYPTVEENEAEINMFNDLYYALEMYFLDDEIKDDSVIRKGFQDIEKKNGQVYIYTKDRYITLDSEGIHFDFGDGYQAAGKIRIGLNQYLGSKYTETFKTTGKEYKIRISRKENDEGYYYVVTAVSCPKSILEKYDK